MDKISLNINGMDLNILYDDRVWGDGEHETTQHILQFIEKYGVADKTVIDIGTGTGILSVFCGKLGAKHILSFDIDPIALEWARRNFKENEIENAEAMINDLTRFYDGKADVILANLPFAAQIDNVQMIKKNMHEDSLLMITWFNRLPFAMYAQDFEVVEHIPGKEYDGYVLKLSK